MKKFLFAMLFALVGTMGIASAQVQLTPAHSGHYFDPFQSGQGVELHVLESGQVIGTFFLGRVPGWYGQPSWLSAQGSTANGGDGSYTFPLLSSITTVLGEENPLVVAAMGEVTIYPLRDVCDANTCLVAHITVDGRGIVPFSPVSDPVTAILYLQRLF